MGSSLNNTDPSYRDSDETTYAEHDVCCPAIPNNGGRLNAYASSCKTKLAMAEIPYHCCKCKGIPYSKPRATREDQFCVCGEEKKKGDYWCEWCEEIQAVEYDKVDPTIQPKCKECGVDLTNRRKKYCDTCKPIVEARRIKRIKTVIKLSEDDFNAMYWDNSMTIPAISKKLGYHSDSLHKYVKRNGYEVRTKSEAGILRENKQQRVVRNAEQEK